MDRCAFLSPASPYAPPAPAETPRPPPRRPVLCPARSPAMSGRTVTIPDDRAFASFKAECLCEEGWLLTHNKRGIKVWIQDMEEGKSVHRIKVRAPPHQGCWQGGDSRCVRPGLVPPLRLTVTREKRLGTNSLQLELWGLVCVDSGEKSWRNCCNRT